MSEVRVEVADTEPSRADAFAVRRTVFVDEQDVAESLEWDDWDDHDATTHFVAYRGGEAVGAARLRPSKVDDQGMATADAAGKVERVAVLQSHRGEGVGRAIMDHLESHGRARGFDEFVLHSQTQAAPFYDRLGYEREGEEFEEAGIPHVKMRKDA